MSVREIAPGSASATKLLAALGAFATYSGNLRLESLAVFLSAAKNPGTGFKELVFHSGLGDSMVSRTVDALCHVESGALLTIERPASDGRRRLVHISETGKKLLAELDDIFESA